MHPYINILEIYMTALDQSDYSAVKRLFVPDGRVKSPFLDEMPAGRFFDRLAGVSLKTVITPIDISLSSPEKNHAIAYFQFDWSFTYLFLSIMKLNMGGISNRRRNC